MVLLYVRVSLIGSRNSIEMIRDEIQRNARLVILGIEKIFELLGVHGGQGQYQSHELGLRRDLAD